MTEIHDGTRHPSRRGSRRRLIRWSAAGLVVVLLLLAVVTWGPHLARDRIAAAMGGLLGREVSIAAIDVDPFRTRVRIEDFVVAGREGTQPPMLQIPEAAASISLWSALQGHLTLDALRLRAPALRIARTGESQFSFQDIIEHIDGSGQGRKEGGAPVRFTIEHADIDGGGVFLADQVVNHDLTIEAIDVSLSDLSNAQGQAAQQPMQGQASLRFAGQQATVSFSGSPFAEPAAMRLQVKTSDIPLVELAPYLQLPGSLRLSGGTLALDVDARYPAPPLESLPPVPAGAGSPAGTVGWALTDSRLALTNAAVTDDSGPVATIGNVSLQGLRLDLASKRVAAESVRLEEGDLTLTRHPDGSFAFRQWLGSADRDAEDKASRQPVKTRAGAQQSRTATQATPAGEWAYRLDLLALEKMRIHFKDQTLPAQNRLPPASLDLEVRDLSNDLEGGLPFQATAGLGDQSALSLKGRVDLQPFAVDAHAGVSGFDFSRLDPYVAGIPNISLVSGRLSGEGEVAISTDDDGLARARFEGALSVNDLRAVEEESRTDFLRWRELAMPTVSVDWLPASPGQSRVEIGDLSIADFFSKVVLDDSGQFNLTQVIAKDGSTGTAEGAASDDAEPSATATAQATKAQSQERPLIRIGRLRIEGGHVNFTDNFVEPNFAADLTRLTGSISGVGTDQNEPAEVSIAGRVNDDGPLEIAGQVNLLAQTRSLDLKGTASDIELTRLTPYAVRWAGYRIDGGTLTAEVRYRVEGDDLSAQNRFVLHEFELGDRVAGTDAPNLPVKLVLSLLRDRDGTIRLNLPISGSLSNPQFSVPGLIAQAVGGLVRNVAAAPFKLLASLGQQGPSGSGSGQSSDSGKEGAGDGAIGLTGDGGLTVDDSAAGLGFVRFEPGRSTLDDEQGRKLRRLSDGLQQRPELGLAIVGYAATPADRAALRRTRLEADLRVAAARETGTGSDAVPDGERRRRLLMGLLQNETASRKQLDTASVDELGIEALEARVLERIDVSEAELLILARDRGENARDALAAAGVASERLTLLAPEFAGAADKLPGTRAGFEIRNDG